VFGAGDDKGVHGDGAPAGIADHQRLTRMTRGIARRSCQSARDKSNTTLEVGLD